MAALVTADQASDRFPVAMSWMSAITLFARPLDIVPRNHQRGPVALFVFKYKEHFTYIIEKYNGFNTDDCFEI